MGAPYIYDVSHLRVKCSEGIKLKGQVTKREKAKSTTRSNTGRLAVARKGALKY